MRGSDDAVLFPPDRTERELAYSPSSCVANIEPFLEAYVVESERVRLERPPLTIRYGPGERAELDVFASGSEQVHCFVHGGYWQQLSKSSASFPAEHFVDAGVTYVAIGYDLCPALSLAEIVGQVRAAVRWVSTEFPDAALTVSGSSAGAHLAAMAGLTEDVDRLILLSGVFDLRPLVGTDINELIGLHANDAAQLSPLLLDPPTAQVKVVWGSNETEAFKRQSQLYATHLAVTGIEVPERNHFDLVHDLFSFSPE